MTMRRLFTPLLVLTLLGLAACLPSLPDTELPSAGTYRVATGIRYHLAARDFLLHIPPAIRGNQPLPLVVVLHGAFSTAAQTETESGFSGLADKECFLVAYPEGIGLFSWLQHWNAGHCCGKAAEDGVDDVGFVAEVIATVEKRLAVDSQRIYLAGMSNGGMLVHRYAAERGEQLAAAAVVSGALNSRVEGEPSWQPPVPEGPLPMLMIHGSADQHVPPDGGSSPLPGRGDRSYASLEEAAAYWRAANGCTPQPQREQLGGAVEKLAWEHCASGSPVELLLLAGWGHRWPGRHFTRQLAPADPLYDFDGTLLIWQFFLKHPMKPEKTSIN